MDDNLYAIKSTSYLTFKTKDVVYKMDYANEVHVQNYVNSYNKKNTLILIFTEMKDDEMPKENINNITIDTIAKKYKDCSDFNKMDKYIGRFDLIYSSYITNYSKVSEFVYAFCDGDVKSGYIKKEINEILNRRKQDELIEKMCNISTKIRDVGVKIAESLKEIKHELQTEELKEENKSIENMNL